MPPKLWSGPAHGERRADLQALRAIAVTAVVLFHAGVPGFGGGFVGVDAFFVVSGFLITGLLWDELSRTGRVSLLDFYARRARRLLPAAALVLAVTTVLGAALLSPLQLHDLAGDVAAAALFAANYRFAVRGTDYLSASSPPSAVQHFWSLGVEEQFYLIWPLLLLLAAVALTRRRPSRSRAVGVLLALGVGSFVLSWRWSVTSPPWAFFSMPSRLWQLAAGGLLALARPWLRALPRTPAALLQWTGLAGLAACVVLVSTAQPYPRLVGLAPVAAVVAVIAGGTAARSTADLRWLGARPVQLVGDASYSWYLWHWPLLVLAPAVVGGPLTAVDKAVVVVLSAVVALLSWRYVEDPVRTSVTLRLRPLRSLAMGAALVAAVVGVGTVGADLSRQKGFGGAAVAAPLLGADALSAQPASPPGTAGLTAGSLVRAAPAHRPGASPAGLTAVERQIRAAVLAASTMRDVPANVTPPLRRAHGDKATPFDDGCHLGFTDTHSGTCAYAHRSSRTTVMLIGDSHATQWFPGLLAVAQARGWRLESLTKSTCPPNELSIFSPYLGRPYRECDTWRRQVLARIRAEKPALVVLGVARHYDASYHFTMFGAPWLRSMTRTVRDIEAAGSHVLVIGPTAKPDKDIPDCLSAHLHSVSSCRTPAAIATHPAGIAAERRAVTAGGGAYLDVTPWMCTRTRCPAMLANMLIYRDDNHLSTAYARWLAPALQPWLVAGVS